MCRTPKQRTSLVLADAASNDPRRFANFCNVVLSHVIFHIFMWVGGMGEVGVGGV